MGIHEGAFKALAFFIELKTIFLDQAIHFPPQIDILTQNDCFHESRQSGLRLSYRWKEYGQLLLLVVLLMVMNDPLPGPAQSGLAAEPAHPIFPIP